MEFNDKNILLDVDVADKLALFNYISDYAVSHGIVTEKQKLIDAFMEREAEVSTGLQDSFAIPHAKTDFINEPIVIFLKLRQPIAWETFDDQPVSNVFALMVPTQYQGTTHLQMISNIATLLMEDDFTDLVKNTTDIQVLSQAISDAMKGNH